MTEQKATTTSWRLFQAMVIFLVLTAMYRTLIPGPYALPGPTTAWMGIVFTLLMGIGVAGMGRQLTRDPQLTESRRSMVTPFMVAALIACAALLLYRVLSTPGFYHGHLMTAPLPAR